MPMPELPDVGLLARRTIEAAVLARVFEVLAECYGEEAALPIVEDVLRREALAAGKAFAASAPDGPSLGHFASMVRQWQHGGALTVEDVERTDTTLAFAVTRCRYVEAYRAMGLPPALVARLSCLRDGAFVAGYSPKLAMDRPHTIAEGDARCAFAFTWDRTKT